MPLYLNVVSALASCWYVTAVPTNLTEIRTLRYQKLTTDLQLIPRRYKFSEVIWLGGTTKNETLSVSVQQNWKAKQVARHYFPCIGNVRSLILCWPMIMLWMQSREVALMKRSLTLIIWSPTFRTPARCFSRLLSVKPDTKIPGNIPIKGNVNVCAQFLCVCEYHTIST